MKEEENGKSQAGGRGKKRKRKKKCRLDEEEEGRWLANVCFSGAYSHPPPFLCIDCFSSLFTVNTYCCVRPIARLRVFYVLCWIFCHLNGSFDGGFSCRLVEREETRIRH